MLERLDSIDWESVSHAYGPATDVPELIRDLVSTDAGVRAHARGKLHGNIWHQGTVYEATGVAAPFLIELVENPDVADRDSILGLLARLARGNSYLEVHRPLFPGADDETAEQKAELDEEMARELGWVQAAHDAVAGGSAVFLRVLEDTDPLVRAAAAHVLAALPERVATTAPILWERLARDPDDRARASIVLALGVLSREPKSEDRARLLDQVRHSGSELVRLAASMALAGLTGPETPDDALWWLRHALEAPPLLEAAYVELPGATSRRFGGLVADAAGFFSFLGPERGRLEITELLSALTRHHASARARAVDDLASAIELARSDPERLQALGQQLLREVAAEDSMRPMTIATRLCETLLFLAFGPSEKRGTGSLAEHQRDVLRAIADRLGSGSSSLLGNAISMLAACGLPTRPEELRRLADG